MKLFRKDVPDWRDHNGPSIPISGVVMAVVDSAPGYYDRDIQQIEARLSALTGIVAKLASTLPDHEQVALAAALHYKDTNGQ